MKRALDLALAGAGVILLSPVMVVLAALVRLSSQGPALFRQTRVGRDGIEFQILKFRSMRVGVDGLAVTVGGDPRITHLGRWLRSTKLDELPQMLNVLCGEMSLVGPRPEAPRYVALWPDDVRREVLSVRPGITDPASIRFRREEEILADADDPERAYIEVITPEKLGLYLDYVRTRSLAGDLRLIAQSLRSAAVD